MINLFKKKKEIGISVEGSPYIKFILTQNVCKKCKSVEPGSFDCTDSRGCLVFSVCLKCVEKMFTDNCGEIEKVELK